MALSPLVQSIRPSPSLPLCLHLPQCSACMCRQAAFTHFNHTECPQNRAMPDTTTSIVSSRLLFLKQVFKSAPCVVMLNSVAPFLDFSRKKALLTDANTRTRSVYLHPMKLGSMERWPAGQGAFVPRNTYHASNTHSLTPKKQFQWDSANLLYHNIKTCIKKKQYRRNT